MFYVNHVYKKLNMPRGFLLRKSMQFSVWIPSDSSSSERYVKHANVVKVTYFRWDMYVSFRFEFLSIKRRNTRDSWVLGSKSSRYAGIEYFCRSVIYITLQFSCSLVLPSSTFRHFQGQGFEITSFGMKTEISFQIQFFICTKKKNLHL